MGWKEYIKEGAIQPHWTDLILNEVSEGGFKLNVAKLPLDKARKYAEEQFNKAKKDLDESLPNFDKNYMLLQKKCKKAKDVPRVEMPVIEPEDMKVFKDRLNKGVIDIFKPIARKEWEELKGVADEQFPKNLTKASGEKWLKLGQKDGKDKDDVVKAKMTKVPANTLYPSQSQIWLEKLISNIVKFGVPEDGGFITKATIIVTKDKYILDGHHRFGQVMLADPKIKMSSLYIPINFDLLLKIGRSYGNAIGRDQKA